MSKSFDRTRLQVSPEKITLDDGNSISKSFNQITLIQTEKENEGVLEDCRKISSVKHSQMMEDFLESKKVTITMSIVTIYALFADDVKTLGFPKSADDAFSSLVVICLLLFALELVLSFSYKTNYKWSFYFWLDLVATLSLITDIGWIWDSLIGVSNSSSNSKQLQNAGKASRAGTRTSRILRIIRLIRLIRLVKLYKNAQIAMKSEEDEEELVVAEINIENIGQESKVGKKLSEVTMKRVILIVLAMLFLLPLFETDFYLSEQTSWTFGVENMKSFLNLEGFEEVKNKYVKYHKKDIRPLVFLSWKNETDSYEWQADTDYNDLRYNEIYYYSKDNFVSIFDIRYDTKLTSLLNIFKTIFICMILTFGALYFTKDSEELVIKPIEKMIEKVKKIAKNPLSASQVKTIQDELDQVDEKTCFCCKSKKTVKAEYETKIIEDTIIKIGVLLALGFGEAGSAIIGSNVETNGELDQMMTGSKVVAIFGFCDIRNFTDTTEELQEGVMMFVNEIAQIIHGVVGKYFGAANKNIGDAFLMVWKFNTDEFFLDQDELIVRNPSSKKASYIPDLALLSFLKILAKVNKDPVILKYRGYQKLLQRMPNYEVKMGFGMHLGWAIEGPIGSQFKIDASYLSPHVNLASALEASTKVYGVPLLISGSLYDMFSSKVQGYCRKIDVIKIKGMSLPISIYTSDCEFSHFQQGRFVSRKKDGFVKKRNLLRKKLTSGEVKTDTLFDKSREVALMRKGFNDEFFKVFELGILAYVLGDWHDAKVKLEKALALRAKDGPSLAILNYISEFEFSAPATWDKSRYLS
jgi:class 3 adenylate cyclase